MESNIDQKQNTEFNNNHTEHSQNGSERRRHNSSEHHSHHSSEHHSHRSHHHSEKLDKEEKRHAIKKLRSFIRAAKHFQKTCHSDSEFNMEVRRYFYDNFHGFERHWLRHHCPIIKRIKLLIIGVNIKKLH